jgi:Flp pilus assembly protein TadG
MRRLKNLFKSLQDDGANSLVETAFSFSILAGMLFGFCQISYAMYIYQFTSDAAREASRWAMVRGNTSCTNTPNLTGCGATSAQIQTHVQTLNYPGIRTANIQATTTWCAASGTTPPISWSSCSGTTASSPGNLVMVSVTYPLSFRLPFASKLFPSSGGALSLTMGSTSKMVITQ